MFRMIFKRVGAIFFAVILSGCAAQQHHRDGMEAMAREDYAKALEELAQAATMAPSDLAYRRDWLRAREDASNKLLGVAANSAATGDYRKAEASYRQVLQYEPDNHRAQSGLAKLAELQRADEEVSAARKAFKEGDVNRAAELAAGALRRVPGHAAAQILKIELDAQLALAIPAVPKLSAVYAKPINLEFRDASIKMVFDALSRTTGINFIFDRDVKPDQRTTVFLKQTSLDDAIDVILSTGQLDKKVLNASSVLIYPNNQAKQREYQDLMVRAFYVANVEAKQTANMLKTVLKLKDIHVEEKSNMLVLRETPETIALAEKLIRLQDLEEPEVMLEVEVLEINRSRLLNAGVQWSSQLTVTPLGATSSTTGSGASSIKLSDLRNLNSDSLGITVPSATINLQKTDADANLLANPRIRVRDREKAKVMIGDKVPVVTTTSTSTFVTENIQYLDVGLKLEVEPDVHLRDEIGLKLSLEVSSLVSSVKTNNGSLAYQIGTRNFNTSLRLKDGETQILAGLINDEDRSAGNRVPLLGDFPVLGRLFGSQNDSRQKTEIVLSITPHLIRNIQRQGPAAESFWSGTETTLRDRPLMLRSVGEKGSDGNARVSGTATVPSVDPASLQTPATAPNAPKLLWTGPATMKSGEVGTFNLRLSTVEKLRAGSVQLGYDPANFEFVSLDDEGYFGKGSFNKSIDAASGRISASFDSGTAAPPSGEGAMLSLKLKARARVADSTIGVISFMPVGAQSVVGRPALPFMHNVTITP